MRFHGVPTPKSDPLETVLPEPVFGLGLAFTHMGHTSDENPSWRSHSHVAGGVGRDLLGQMQDGRTRTLAETETSDTRVFLPLKGLP